MNKGVQLGLLQGLFDLCSEGQNCADQLGLRPF